MIHKGWIALDIDGTITLDKYSVPEEVVAFLRDLHQKGWKIAMATGRPFAFASLALSRFDFPYLFLPQNGSIALEMPERKILFKNYIPTSVLPVVEKAYEGTDTDFLIYAGYEKGDFCYWRPQRIPREDFPYLEDLQKRQKEKWEAVQTYASLPLDAFPLIKCFGHESQMKIIAKRLRDTGKFEVAQIRDPFAEEYRLLLVTDQKASKGLSLSKLLQIQGRGSCVIAAGDDENDLSLLQVADIKIAMAHAPESLQQVASFIAPPTQERGIIKALQLAIRDAR